MQTLSSHQRALIDIANGATPSDTKILFVLQQRGLIERIDGTWRVFAEAMRQFVLKQQELEPSIRGLPVVPVQAGVTSKPPDDLDLTYLEGRAYEYLKVHVGEVCDREDLKSAVWEGNEPSNSALQKIIERIREKIEQDAASTYELIAVRGRGYMLRKIP
ncbi:MAG: helix-turn-helix domain-containing protein [Chloroflexota bacterium]|nr:helix-turn-helix domain-containing protein [Chloroflexota bacterium]